MKRIPGILAIIAMSSAASAGDLFFPDPKDTPGATNPEVTEENILQTVCQSAWLEKIQPSPSYIDELKAKQIQALQLQGGPTDYEEDHLVPLCAGGHPSDPQPVAAARERRLELQSQRRVRNLRVQIPVPGPLVA